jgi:transposase InsO family protein
MDETQLSVVTGIDDHSRFCVIAKVVARATARSVCDALLEGLSRHGVPEQILTRIQDPVPARGWGFDSPLAHSRFDQRFRVRCW